MWKGLLISMPRVWKMYGSLFSWKTLWLIYHVMKEYQVANFLLVVGKYHVPCTLKTFGSSSLLSEVVCGLLKCIFLWPYQLPFHCWRSADVSHPGHLFFLHQHVLLFVSVFSSWIQLIFAYLVLNNNLSLIKMDIQNVRSIFLKIY